MTRFLAGYLDTSESSSSVCAVFLRISVHAYAGFRNGVILLYLYFSSFLRFFFSGLFPGFFLLCPRVTLFRFFLCFSLRPVWGRSQGDEGAQ